MPGTLAPPGHQPLSGLQQPPATNLAPVASMVKCVVRRISRRVIGLMTCCACDASRTGCAFVSISPTNLPSCQLSPRKPRLSSLRPLCTTRQPPLTPSSASSGLLGPAAARRRWSACKRARKGRGLAQAEQSGFSANSLAQVCLHYGEVSTQAIISQKNTRGHEWDLQCDAQQSEESAHKAS